MDGLQAAQERSGEAVWRLVKAGGLEPGRGKWLGELVKGSGVEAGRQEFSGCFSRNCLEAGRASWSQSSSKEVVWTQAGGSGLWHPEKPKAGSLR